MIEEVYILLKKFINKLKNDLIFQNIISYTAISFISIIILIMSFAIVLEFYFSINIKEASNKIIIIMLSTITYSTFFIHNINKEEYFRKNFNNLKLSKNKINEMKSFLYKSSLISELIPGVFIVCTILVSMDVGLESVPLQLSENSDLAQSFFILLTIPLLYYLHTVIIYNKILNSLESKKFKRKTKKRNSSQLS